MIAMVTTGLVRSYTTRGRKPVNDCEPVPRKWRTSYRLTLLVIKQVIGTFSTEDPPTDGSLLHDAALEQVTIGIRRTRRIPDF
jgi:hypothetical protein